MIPTPNALTPFDGHDGVLRLERPVVVTPHEVPVPNAGPRIDRSCMTPGDKDALGIEELQKLCDSDKILPSQVGFRGTPLQALFDTPASAENDRAQDAYERQHRLKNLHDTAERIAKLRANNAETYTEWHARMEQHNAECSKEFKSATAFVPLDGDIRGLAHGFTCVGGGGGGLHTPASSDKGVEAMRLYPEPAQSRVVTVRLAPIKDTDLFASPSPGMQCSEDGTGDVPRAMQAWMSQFNGKIDFVLTYDAHRHLWLVHAP